MLHFLMQLIDLEVIAIINANSDVCLSLISIDDCT